MDNNISTNFTLPVGYHKFHRKQLFNFQLNRWHSLGYARYEDMVRAGRIIKDFAGWTTEMIRMAEDAEADGRLINAAFYYRAAEFYILKDTGEKKGLYDKFIGLFDRAFRDDAIERFEVPYRDAYLPAMRVSPDGAKKGTIVMHGGFDSFIEEFYSWAAYFADSGYEVIAFEGRGRAAHAVNTASPSIMSGKSRSPLSSTTSRWTTLRFWGYLWAGGFVCGRRRSSRAYRG